MNVCHNIYEYIMQFTDNKTTLNMLSVNKKYYDDEILLRVINKKYPLLAKLKSQYESWRRFYVKMIFSMEKCLSIYGISYLPHKNFNPYKLSKDDESIILNYNKIMVYAVEIKDIDIVNLMIEKGANDFNKGLISAAKSGDTNRTIFMLNKGATSIDRALISAAKYGHLEIVKIILDKGATRINTALYYATKGSHIDIIKLLIAKDSKNNKDIIILRGAARGGNLELFRLTLAKITEINPDDLLIYAIKGGNLEILKILIDKGATKWENYIHYAAIEGNLDIVKHLYDKISAHRLLIRLATTNGHMDIINYFLTERGIDINTIMAYAASGDQLDIVKRMITKGATDFRSALSSAAASNKLKMVKFLDSKIGNSKFDYRNAIDYASNCNHSDHSEVLEYLRGRMKIQFQIYGDY